MILFLLLSSMDDASSCRYNSEMSFCHKQWMRCSVSLEAGSPVVHHTGRFKLSVKVHSHPAHIEVEKVQLGQLDFLFLWRWRRFTSHPKGLSDERWNVFYVTRTRTSPVSLTESFYFKVEVLLLFCFSKAVCGMRRQFDQDGGENLREASHCRGEWSLRMNRRGVFASSHWTEYQATNNLDRKATFSCGLKRQDFCSTAATRRRCLDVLAQGWGHSGF